jgi:hypothetical protein
VDRGVLVGFSDTLRCFDLDVAEVGRGGLAHLAVGGAPGPASDDEHRQWDGAGLDEIVRLAGPDGIEAILGDRAYAPFETGHHPRREGAAHELA